MNDPFGLEPPGGDYVGYIEDLQRGRVRSLEPLHAAGGGNSRGIPSQSAPGEASAKRKTLKLPGIVPLPGRKQSGSLSSAPAQISAQGIPETPQERMKRRAREANRKQGGAAMGSFAAFLGFTLFVLGGASGNEWLIPLGMLTAVVGFWAATKR